jgi:hypothetical protein
MFSTSDGLGNDSVFLMSTSGYGISTAWNHILISWDAATGADHMYINGTNVSDGALHINNNVAIAYAAPNWRVGMSYSGFNKLNGCMAELYFAPNQYLDFSVEGNRRINNREAGISRSRRITPNWNSPYHVSPS